MSSGIHIYLRVKPYIRQYIESVYGNPARFRKQSYTNLLLCNLLSRAPEGAKVRCRAEGDLAIELPLYSAKNVSSYNYLSQRSERRLESHFRQMFYEHLTEEIKRARRGQKVQYQEAIYMFIERYGIDAGAFETLKKKHYRDRLPARLVKKQ
jgi:hypothetical protein